MLTVWSPSAHVSAAVRIPMLLNRAEVRLPRGPKNSCCLQGYSGGCGDVNFDAYWLTDGTRSDVVHDA